MQGPRIPEITIEEAVNQLKNRKPLKVGISMGYKGILSRTPEPEAPEDKKRRKFSRTLKGKRAQKRGKS